MGVSNSSSRIGLTAAPTAAAGFGARLRRKMEINGRIVRRLGLKAD